MDQKELSRIAGRIWFAMNPNADHEPITFNTVNDAILEAYQAGIRRAMEIVRFQDDNGGYMSDILTALDAELHGNKTTS